MINEHTEKEIREKLLEYVFRMSPVAYFPNPIPPLTATQEMVLQEMCNYVLSQYASLDASRVEMVRGLKREEFVEAFDNDGHRYQIPTNKRDEWYKWCEIPSDNEESWDTPDFAERIDGMPIKQNSGFNDGLSAVLTNVFNEKK